jgi:hypothetical protein
VTIDAAVRGSGVNMAATLDRAVPDGIVLSNGMRLSQITDAVGVISFNYQAGAVAELTIKAVDVGRVLSRGDLLREGTSLTYDGSAWQVAAVERDYLGGDIWLTFTVRSRLARRLRNMTGPDKATDVTPAQWITSKVKKAGGTALVEPGARRRTIAQKRNESVLDVIGNLASDTGVEWVEFGNKVFVGTPWWAFQGNTNLPTWNAFADGTVPDLSGLEVLGVNSRSSLDDRTNGAEASITVTAQGGSLVRPWHRVNLGRADRADNGIWLVRDVSFDTSGGAASISLQRPLKSSPKKGSQGTDSDGTSGELTPVAGSSYSDAPRPAGFRGRTVAQILNIWNNNRGGLNHTIYNGCLWYAQEVAGYPHIGANPHVLWPMVPAGSRKSSREVPPGAVLLYRNSNVGHATVYVGGGRVLSTDMNSAGGYAQGQWSVGPADAAERSFGSLLGWYMPW